MNEGLNLNLSRSLFDYQPESVNNKSVLITGGTTGIGRATAVLLAAQGAQVMIFGRHEQELNDAMHDIRAAGGEIWVSRPTPPTRKISNACSRKLIANWIIWIF